MTGGSRPTPATEGTPPERQIRPEGLSDACPLSARVYHQDDATLAEVLVRPSSPAASTSLVLPHQEEVTEWWKQGIQGTTIHQALIRKYGFAGSYSSVRRYLAGLEAAHPQATTVLEFAPGEAAQVDFGTGPEITDVYTGEVFATWVFVMTLACSRHQHVELVCDQKVATGLGCHRRAFEWFHGVPARVMPDYVSGHIMNRLLLACCA